MISGDAHALAPYRLEWRASLTTGWVRIVDLDEHSGDLKAYVDAQDGWSWAGQWRLVSQHVIEAEGLGA